MNRQRRIWTDLHHIDGSILVDGNGGFKTNRLMEIIIYWDGNRIFDGV